MAEQTAVLGDDRAGERQHGVERRRRETGDHDVAGLTSLDRLVGVGDDARPPHVRRRPDAGAAQLATVSLAATATWLTLVATAAVINLRHVMYSAALSPRFNDQPRWFRWVGPFLLIDQLFALTSVRTTMPGPAWRRFYLSAGIFYFVSWMTVVTIGLVVGSSIPTEWRLDVAPAIMFAGLVVLGLANRPGIVAAVVGAGVCLLALDVPNNGGILVGAISGVIAGYVADVTASRRAEQRSAAGAP